MNKKSFPLLMLTCICFACSASPSSDPNNPSNSRGDSEIITKINLIEKSFESGDDKEACDLQLSLSKNIENFEEISPKLIKKVKKIQLKCSSRMFTIDLN